MKRISIFFEDKRIPRIEFAGIYMISMMVLTMLIAPNLCWAKEERKSGVTIYNPKKSYKGYTLFCPIFSGKTGIWTPIGSEQKKGVKAPIFLINMEGEVVHKWEVKTTINLAKLQPNGNLLYSTQDRTDIKQAGLYMLSPESKVSWKYHCRIDHDFQVLDNGNFMIHTLMDKMVPKIGPELKRCPYIIEVTPDSKIVWEWVPEYAPMRPNCYPYGFCPQMKKIEQTNYK